MEKDTYIESTKDLILSNLIKNLNHDVSSIIYSYLFYIKYISYEVIKHNNLPGSIKIIVDGYFDDIFFTRYSYLINITIKNEPHVIFNTYMVKYLDNLKYGIALTSFIIKKSNILRCHDEEFELMNDSKYDDGKYYITIYLYIVNDEISENLYYEIGDEFDDWHYINFGAAIQLNVGCSSVKSHG